MNALPRKVTAYSEYVFSNLPQQMAVGQGLYNYEELAQMVGLKPTGNFRRRIKQLVANGSIEAQSVFTERGGIEVRFSLPDASKMELGIPF